MGCNYSWRTANRWLEEGREVYICIGEGETRRVSIGRYEMEGECPNDPYCYGHYRQWYESDRYGHPGGPVEGVTHFRRFPRKNRPIYPLPDPPKDPAA